MLLVFYNCIICLQNIFVYFFNWCIISIFCPACKVLYYQTQSGFFIIKDSEISFERYKQYLSTYFI